jgi:hypothetical protein
MARYFFTIYNDLVTEDEEGADFVGVQEARAAAVRAARGLMAAHVVEKGRIDLSHRIDIADDKGEVVASVSFGEALEVRG